MTAPLVSVIIPAYNAEPYIGQAIESVLEQTLPDLELIVVDDRSSDGTNEIIASYAAKDNRIRHLRRKKNGGPGLARNTAIEEARGVWVAILDADDWYEPPRLEKLINAANLDGVPVATDNQRFVMAADGSWEQLLVDRNGSPVWRLDADDLLRGDQLQRTSRNLGLLKPVIRRSFLSAHGISYDSEITLGEDFYFLLKCLRHSPHLVFVSEPLYNYRVYVPLTHTKRVSREGFLALRTLHGRYRSLFDPVTAPSTAGLMEERRLEIERYIRFKQFAEPLKRGEIGAFLKQVRNDPVGLLLLLKKAASDPRAGAAHLFSLGQRALRKTTDCFRRPHKTELGR